MPAVCACAFLVQFQFIMVAIPFVRLILINLYLVLTIPFSLPYRFRAYRIKEIRMMTWKFRHIKIGIVLRWYAYLCSRNETSSGWLMQRTLYLGMSAMFVFFFFFICIILFHSVWSVCDRAIENWVKCLHIELSYGWTKELKMKKTNRNMLTQQTHTHHAHAMEFGYCW